jgi:integrase
MATLTPSSDRQPGRTLRCIEFSLNGGRRQRINLGQTTGREGEDFRRRVEQVIADVQLGRQHDGSLCSWLNALSPRIQKRLVDLGLLKASRQADVRLGDFIASHKRTAAGKKSTKLTYGNVYRNLLEHFGPNRLLQSIGRPEAIGFKEFLQSPTTAYDVRPLSKATISRRIIMARQFFKVALEKELITVNPFVGVKGGHQRNPERLEFIEADRVNQMVAAAEEQDWKLLLLLARYGGIRIPSEVVRLQWQHVDFARDRILIHSVKTEQYAGKAQRYIPIFDELRQPLLDARAKGVDALDFVIQNRNYRQPEANTRQQFERVAKRAKVAPWKKAWQNQRATRESELIERIGLKEACAIIGNSEVIALQHYQMLRPQFMKSAIELDREAKKEGQNRGYIPSEPAGNGGKRAADDSDAAGATANGFQSYPLDSSKCLPLQDLRVGDTDPEPNETGLFFRNF